ncbi:MAG TPA: AsmA family protein, partial [Nitrospira sp.]|nr:AsmA family protein [Nitrospira sp.]
MMKVLVWLGAAFFLLIAIALSLPFLIDLNKYQEQYRPAVEEALNRKISLQDIQLTLWPRIGARLAGFVVMDDPAFGERPFSSFTSVGVGVKLLPLLTGKVEVEEITLVDPVIAIIKNEQGVLNVSTLGRHGVAAPKTPSRAPIPSPEGPLKILAMLAVDRISITGGKLTYHDLSADKPTEYVLQDLEFLLQPVRLGQSPGLHLATLVQPFNLPVALDGTFGPLKEAADIDAINLQLALGKTVFAIAGSTAGRHANFQVSAPVVNTADLPLALPLKNAVEVKDLRIAAEVTGQDILLDNLSFQLFDGQVTAKGGMTSGTGAPPFNGRVLIEGVKLGPVMETIGTDALRVSGSAAGSLALQGRGFTKPDLTQALDGTGKIAVKDGRIEGVNLMQEVSALFKVVGLSQDDVKATAFTAIEADVGIKQGLVNVQRLLMDSHDFQATGTGTVGFDRALNLQVNLNLSEALSQKLSAGASAARLALSGGRLAVPMVITGTLQAPSYGLDTKAVGAKVQEQVKEKVKEAAGELLTGSGRPEDMKQQGQKLLKGLLGR